MRKRFAFAERRVLTKYFGDMPEEILF